MTLGGGDSIQSFGVEHRETFSICRLFHNLNLQHVTNKSHLSTDGLTFQVIQSSSVACGLEVRSCASVTKVNTPRRNSNTAGNKLHFSVQATLVTDGVVES